MAVLWTIISVSTSLFLTPFFMFILAIIFLASIGKSIGVRRLFVKVLLKIFEYGRENIEIAQKVRRNQNGDVEESDDSEGEAEDDSEKPKSDDERGDADSNKNNWDKKNGVLISHEVILAVDPEQNYKSDVTDEVLESPEEGNEDSPKREFELWDCLDFVKGGVEAIIEDLVTSRFEAEELRSWNLLTRTNRHYEFISWRLTVIWMFGFVMRYFFLFPLRVLICFFGIAWLLLGTLVVGSIPGVRMRRVANKYVMLTFFRLFIRALSTVTTFHNEQWAPKPGGLCVANHTTPVDVCFLSSKTCFSLIGQRHGGFLGVLQRALARASPHIWFERSEVKDREAVAQRLRKHVSDPNNPPILIFPEGTCINNTSVMQFKKGSFEVGGTIYPVAIKYDPRFGDPFWNSSRYSMMQYLYMMMTSWAIVCDVWYLPPMTQQEGESAIDFANRVKKVIAKQGGLVDLMWDGQLKRSKPKPEWKERQQEEYSKRLKVE